MKAWAVVVLGALICGAHAAESGAHVARRASRQGLRANVAAMEDSDAAAEDSPTTERKDEPELSLELVGQIKNDISPVAGAATGAAVCGLGDVNGDGIPDVGFGAPAFRIGSTVNIGRFYVQLLNEKGDGGKVVAHANPSTTVDQNFGASCAGVGDVDQDGVPDAVVGRPLDSKSDSAGEVQVLLLAKDGSVRKTVTVAGSKHGASKGALFGSSVAGLGRFFEGKAQHGAADIVVGAPNDGAGRVFLLQILKDGSVGKTSVIKSGSPNFVSLEGRAQFGAAVAYLGDVNGDGIGDIAVGAPGAGPGAVYVLLLTADGGVKETVTVHGDNDAFGGRDIRRVGESLFAVGDADGNGVPDLGIGLPFENGAGGAPLTGAAYVLLLQSTGKPVPGVAARFPSPAFRPSAIARGFDSANVVARLPSANQLLVAVGNPGQLSADGGLPTGGVRMFRFTADAAARHSLGEDERVVTHALFPYLRATGKAHDCRVSDWSDWSTCSVKCGIGYIHRDRTIFEEAVGIGKPCPTNIVEHESCDKGPCEPASVVDFGLVSDRAGGFSAPNALEKGAKFGGAVASIGDVNGDEYFDMAVGAPASVDGRGEVFVLELGEDYVPVKTVVLGSAKGGMDELPAKARFGSAIAGLGDLNQDGVPDVIVGAAGESAAYVLTMTKAGKAAKAHQFSLATTKHRPAGLAEDAATGLGASAVGVGMLLGDDDVPDAALGLPSLDGGKGGVLLLRLAADGTVAGTVLLRASELRKSGGGPSDACGAAVAYLGDVDGDGVGDIAVGCPGARSDAGEILVVLLTAKGEARSVVHIHGASTGFDAKLTGGSRMGASLVGVGDVDGDGVVDVAAGAPSSNARDQDAGALYVILLNPTGHLKHVSRSLPAGGMYGAHNFASVAVIDFTPDNRTLVLASGAPDAKAADAAPAAGARIGAVTLGHMSVEQRSDTVSDLPTFPTLHIPRDCVLSDWTAYSNCSESCGGGVQFRTRAILVKNEPGGRACDQFEYEQSRVCNTQHCPIDCVMADWGEWGNCSTDCDGGVQFRSRAVQVFPDFGGKPCSGNTTERRPCNTQGCPVACEVSPWSSWSECSEPCGGGEQERNRTVLVAPTNGGATCPNTTQTRECNKQHCPIECEVGPWTEWSMCNTTCGGGERTRTREIVQRPMYGADACPALDDTEACNTHECPFDCKLSEWSDWGECSEWCGPGVQERHRDVLKFPSPDGKPCGNTTEARTCEARACPIDCEVGAWGKWDACSAECGPGRTARTRKVKVHPAHGGEACPALKEEKDCLEKHCPIDCVLGQWGNWSACDPSCGPGEQTRKRRVLVEPDFGGKECAALEQTQACNAKPCPVDCEVSEWEFDGGCSERCGSGERKRKRHVTVHPKHGGKACPALTGLAPCNTFPCAKPVLDAAPCAQFASCAACSADDRCGWARSIKKCLPGVVRGPTPLWTASPHYMEDPYKEFLHDAGITEWEFAYCKGARCGEYKTCDTCISDPLCGFCPSTGQCLYGTQDAPTRGQYCPRGWTYAPELLANHTALLPRDGDIRVTEPRPSHAQLAALCEADSTTRSLLWKRLVADAEQERPADNCLPCEGQYPFCDCSRHLDADARASPTVNELAAAAASEAERQLAEEAAEAQAQAAEAAVHEAETADVTGSDKAFEAWEVHQRDGIAGRAEAVGDKAAREVDEDDA